MTKAVPSNFLISPRRGLIRFIFIILGVILMSIGFLESLDSGREKTLWVIDNSLSMAVADIHTESGVMISRLDLAKQLIIKNSSHIGGEQGVLSAAQNARLELPMTDDSTIFTEVVNGVNLLSYGGGSMISSPLELIRLVYGTTSDLHIIWITDGEFSDSGATFSGFTMIPDMTFIGVGSRAGGPILEGYNSDGYPRYKESGGKKVNSIRDDIKLSFIASSLDAQVIFFDSDTDTKIPIKNTTHIEYQYLLTMFFGVLCILFGLMYPRYSYFLK